MHAYSTTCEDRITILGLLGALSVPLAFGLSQALEQYGWNKFWYFDYPSVLGIFGILFSIFNVWIWHVCRHLKLVKTPNLQGSWVVVGKSSFDNFQANWHGTLTIKQTWSRIDIELETSNSCSRSLSAAIFPTPSGVEISYEYLNVPKAAAGKNLHPHRGVARLKLKTLQVLEGDYFTGRSRGETGEIKAQLTP